MLCSKFKQIPLNTAANNVTICSAIPKRQFSKKCINFLAFARLHPATRTMASTIRFRNIVKNLFITRLYTAWSRSYIVSSMVKRCRKDRAVRDAIQCFRQSIMKPKRTLLFTVTAAYKSHEEKPGKVFRCSKSITDEELQGLANDFEGVEELAKATLYCAGCAKRVVIDSAKPGVRYCACKDAPPPQQKHDGWEPYMDSEEVIIWRKEYKGKGLYAYKVYGRYKDIEAPDFAAIQVDGAYRRVWDTAVAALSVVEKQANGVHDQMILHWEVLWPRLFANRDYVYMRRHKEFDVKSRCLTHKDGIFNPEPCKEEIPVAPPVEIIEKPNVHSNAKRKAMEEDKKSLPPIEPPQADDKAYIIISRSCIHPLVPETTNAVRVKEYWSHMVVKTLNGPGKPGMEFVLTYYDEPAMGGMPSAVTSWATGRAAPAFLERMRKAAADYKKWRAKHQQREPDFTPFGPEKVSYEDNRPLFPFNEQDMESSRRGPDLSPHLDPDTREQSTQTETPGASPDPNAPPYQKINVEIVYPTPKQDRGVGTEPYPIVTVTREDSSQSSQSAPVAAVAEATKMAAISQNPPESTNKYADKSVDKSAEKSVDKSADKSAEKSADKSVDKSAEKSADKSDDQSEDALAEEEQGTSLKWWRYLHPYYYFV